MANRLAQQFIMPADVVYTDVANTFTAPQRVTINSTDPGQATVISTNTNSVGKAQFEAVNDLGHGASLIEYGSTVGAGLANLGVVGSDTGLCVMTNYNTTTGTDPITFRVGGYDSSNERMRLTSAGALGLGTTTPGAQLTINNTAPDVLTPFVTDTFTVSGTETVGEELTAHRGELGATWSAQDNTEGEADITAAGRLRLGGNRGTSYWYTRYQALGTPASPDYTVSADFYLASLPTTVTDWSVGLTGRQTGPTTYYEVFYDYAGLWHLDKYVNGGVTTLGTAPVSFAVGATHNVALVMQGTQLSAQVDGVTVIGPITDTSITAAGMAGLWMWLDQNSGFVPGDAAGMQLDNFSAIGLAPPTAALVQNNGVTGATIDAAGNVVTSGHIEATGAITTSGLLRAPGAAIRVGHATDMGLTIKSALGQSASLLQFQDSNGGALSYIDSGGNLSCPRVTFWGQIDPGLGGSIYTNGYPGISPGSTIHTTQHTINMWAWNASDVVLSVSGNPGHTANLQEWLDSSQNVLATITAAGNLQLGAASPKIQWLRSDISNSTSLTFQPYGTDQDAVVNVTPNGTSTNAAVVLHTDTAMAGGEAKLAFGGGASGMRAGTFSFASVVDSAPSALSRDLGFMISNGTLGRSERLTIQASTGNVGVGTITPNAGLHVLPPSAITAGLYVQAYPGQTADLLDLDMSQSSQTHPATLAFTNSTSAAAWRALGPPFDYIQSAASMYPQIATYYSLILQGNNQNDSGVPLPFVYAVGSYGTPQPSVIVQTARATDHGLAVRGVAGQSGDLQQWQASDGSILSALSHDGTLTTDRLSVTGATSSIKSENWDSVTAPAIPAGWSVDSLWLRTATTNSPTSAPNSLVYPAAAANGGAVPMATWNTPDGNNGDVQVSATFRFANASGAGEQDLWVYARGATLETNANFRQRTDYSVAISMNPANAPLTTFGLQKNVNGASTSLGYTSDATLFVAGTNYRVFLVCHGSTIQARCQRLSDGYWLSSSYTWVSDPTNSTVAISVTDTSVVGAGYAGVGTYLQNALGGDIGVDDWLLERAGNTAPVAQIATSNPMLVPLVVKGAAGQVSDIQQWQASDGTLLGRVFNSVSRGPTITSDNVQANNWGLQFTDGNDLEHFRIQTSPTKTIVYQPLDVYAPITIAQSTATPALVGVANYNADLISLTRGGGSGAMISVNQTAGQCTAFSATTTSGAYLQNNPNTIFYGNGTYQHTGGEGLGRGLDLTVTNNVGNTGMLWGALINATANTAGATALGLSVSAASSAGASTVAQFVCGSPTTVGTVVQGSAGQTGDLQRWEDGAGGVLATVDAGGNLTCGNIATGSSSISTQNITASFIGCGELYVTSSSNAVALGVIGHSGQTADLQQWSDSTSAVLAKVDASGNLTAQGLALSPTTTTTAPAAGAAGAVPSQPTGWATVTIGGQARQVPYW